MAESTGSEVSKEKEAIDWEMKRRLAEAARFSFVNLREFLDSDKEITAIERDLTLDDLKALKILSYEVGIIKNQYGIFSWKGDEEETHTPFVFRANRDFYRAMFRSHIYLDLHNHPTDFFSNDQSLPSASDMTHSRTHDIIIVGKEGISVTSPILRDPTKDNLEFPHDPQIMYARFFQGASSYYDGKNWLRFLEAAGAKYTFYKWNDIDDIRRNVLERAPQDGSYLAWIDSKNPCQRAIALSVFNTVYSDKDFTADPSLFNILNKFCNDSEPFVRDEANKTLERIKANIEYRKKNPR